MGLNYAFTHDFVTLQDAEGLNGLGLMSVCRGKERFLFTSLEKRGVMAAVLHRNRLTDSGLFQACRVALD
jgi:hypothetical protein